MPGAQRAMPEPGLGNSGLALFPRSNLLKRRARWLVDAVTL